MQQALLSSVSSGDEKTDVKVYALILLHKRSQARVRRADVCAGRRLAVRWRYAGIKSSCLMSADVLSRARRNAPAIRRSLIVDTTAVKRARPARVVAADFSFPTEALTDGVSHAVCTAALKTAAFPTASSQVKKFDAGVSLWASLSYITVH
jgi:hypothetical protein